MGWEVLQQLRNRTIDWLQFRGSFMGTAQNVRVLLKDRDNNAIVARIEEGVALPQRRRGFAKGCILFVNSTGPANQNTKGLYENVGTALLSRFNVVGAVVDPEILLPHKRILLGQHNGYSKDVAISGAISIAEDGTVSLESSAFPLADSYILVGGADGEADAVAMSGVLEISNTGVTSYAAQYDNTHRVVAAGVTDGVADADGVIRVNNWRIAGDDVAIATLYEADHDVAVERARCKEGRLDIYLTGAGGANTRVNYVVYREVGTAASSPATSAPTTYASTSPPLSTDEPTTLPPTTPAPTTAAPTTAAPTTAAPTTAAP